MPAIPLISVDLPAPLSPTSAVTSPLRTSRSTSVSAWTEPKDFETPRSSRRGVSLIRKEVVLGGDSRRAASRAPGGLLAVLRVDPVADVALLQETAREEELVVRLRDRLRGDQERLLETAALRGDVTGRREGLALDDVDGGGGSGVRQLPHVLEHRHRLPARDDVLDALRR